MADSLRWRGKILTGIHAHWCPEWDFLPIDETTPEWPCPCSLSDHAREPMVAGDLGLVECPIWFCRCDTRVHPEHCPFPETRCRRKWRER